MLKKNVLRQRPKWSCFTAPNSRSSRYCSIRPNSSTPERSRKLPGSEKGATLTSWQKRTLIVFATSIVLYQSYTYYDRQRLKSSFVTYKLIAKEPVSSTISIFHLSPSEPSTDFEIYRQAWKRGIWNVHFKQPQIQVVRAYTPLPPSDNAEQPLDQNLRFLIRHDPHGEVSSYLHRLPVGSQIELRGPNLEYQLNPDVKQVVFFAGGTGIAPALQIAHAMFDQDGSTRGDTGHPGKSRKLHILWASRRREDCEGGASDAPIDVPKPSGSSWGGFFMRSKAKPVQIPLSENKGLIVQELEQLKQKYPGQVTVEYFVNAENTWIDEDVVFNTMSRFDEKDFSKGSPSSSEQRQILISGPNGFISYLAGPKEWRGGREEQGNVSKIIAHAIAQNPHHVKVWKV